MSWRGFGTRPWLIVPVASALHMTYGLGLLADTTAYDVPNITAVYIIAWLFGGITPFVLFGVASLALLPMFRRMYARNIQLCLWPQQLLLCLMAGSVLLASAHGQYPDGTVKNWLYILIDQAWAIYFMAAHFVATLRNAIIGWAE